MTLALQMLRRASHEARQQSKEHVMGKYFIGWLLGVPVVVLVILYFVFGG